MQHYLPCGLEGMIRSLRQDWALIGFGQSALVWSLVGEWAHDPSQASEMHGDFHWGSWKRSVFCSPWKPPDGIL